MLSHSICISTEPKLDEFMVPSRSRPNRGRDATPVESGPKGVSAFEEAFVSGKPVDHGPQKGARNDSEHSDPRQPGKGHAERAAEARFVGRIVGGFGREIVLVHGGSFGPQG